MKVLTAETLDRLIEELSEEVDSAEGTLYDLRIKLDAYKDLRRQFEFYEESEQTHANANGRHIGMGKKPREAVVQLLRHQPDLAMSEILDQLEDRVSSSAKNIRHNLRTTVFNLTKKGTVSRDEHDRYRLVK